MNKLNKIKIISIIVLVLFIFMSITSCATLGPKENQDNVLNVSSEQIDQEKNKKINWNTVAAWFSMISNSVFLYIALTAI